MDRGRDGCAGELAPAPLLAVLLDHVPECHQVQCVQHLIPPLPFALHAFRPSTTLTGAGNYRTMLYFDGCVQPMMGHKFTVASPLCLHPEHTDTCRNMRRPLR